MKMRFFVLALTIGCLSSCSSTRKAQTTDDVYYSSGNQQDNSSGGYVANDGSDDRVQATSTADNYNQYAYGDDYAPFSTCISPYWGGGFGMSPYYMGGYYSSYYAYAPYGFGMGMGWGNFFNSYPSYYGGYYNPYYPGYGYYTKAYAGSSPYFPGRIAAVTYNNRHFNNINTTVPTMRGINPNRPVINTVSGRTPVSLASNKVTTSQWQPYRVTTDNRGSTRQTTNRSVVRQNNNVRTNNNQPTYRPASNSNATFGRSSGGFGGGGGGRVGGGGGSFGRGGRN